MNKVIFGYRHVNIPRSMYCPCGDPGNYCALELRSDGVYELHCWCGSKSVVTFDDDKELNDFIKSCGGTNA